MYYTRKRAVLACNFCRQRKRKCDGKKPCTTCEDADAKCVYQELPVERTEESVPATVTDQLSRIEAILEQQSQQIQQLYVQSSRDPNSTNRSDYVPAAQQNLMQLPRDFNPSLEHSLFLIPKNHTAVTTALLAFPQVQAVVGEYPRDCFKQMEEKSPLPGLLDRIHDGPLTWPVLVPQTMVVNLAARNLRLLVKVEVTVPLLKIVVEILAANYFQHVHPHQPLFTPRTFRSWQATLLETQDLEGNTTAICLCVYALGALLLPHNDHQKAPDTLGLEYFQPALKIIIREVLWGFRPGVLGCQALLLAASYFAHLGRPVHSLRMNHFASRMFLGLLESRQSNPTHAEFDDTELRVYWQCFMVECDGVTELDVSRSGIEPLGDTMPLPQSLESSEDMNHIYSITEHAIRRLLNRIISSLYDPDSTHRYPMPSPDPARVWQKLGFPKLLSLSAELDRQLEQWYHSIPTSLRFPKGTAFLPNDRSRVLRIRYYMARHLIYRPFLLQTVSRQQKGQSPPQYSSPGSNAFGWLERIIMEGCQACINSCVTYLYNAIDMIDKRSPYLWTFSQSCIATLVLLWLAENSAQTSHLVPATRPIQNIVLDKLHRWAVGNPSFDTGVRIVEQLTFSDRQ